MIEDILPLGVWAAEAFADDPNADLFPEERQAIAAAVESRRREFATVRACARSVLAQMGEPAGPILPGRHGAPGWPPGVVGSMTHCTGYRAAVVARGRDATTIGIDAEPNEPLPEGILDRIASGSERARLAVLGSSSPRACWDRLLFCTKEAVYKAWYPLTPRWIGFEEVDVDIDPFGGTFVARLLSPGPIVEGRRVTRFSGRWLAADGLLVTAIVLPRVTDRISGPAPEAPVDATRSQLEVG